MNGEIGPIRKSNEMDNALREIEEVTRSVTAGRPGENADMKKWIDYIEKKVDKVSQDLEAVIKEMDFWKNENDTLKSTLEKNNSLLRKIFETFEQEAEK